MRARQAARQKETAAIQTPTVKTLPIFLTTIFIYLCWLLTVGS